MCCGVIPGSPLRTFAQTQGAAAIVVADEAGTTPQQLGLRTFGGHAPSAQEDFAADGIDLDALRILPGDAASCPRTPCVIEAPPGA
jgi:hypothetical protein